MPWGLARAMAAVGSAEEVVQLARFGLGSGDASMGTSGRLSDFAERPPDDPQEHLRWRQQVLLAEEGESQLSTVLVPYVPPVRLLYTYCFLVCLEWSMVIPSIVPYFYLLEVDKEIAEEAKLQQARLQYALAQSGYALMQLVSSLLFRLLLRRTGEFLPVFVSSSLLMIAGGVLYACADPSALNSSSVLLAGRFFCGLGGGGSSVGIMYLAQVCLDDPRRGQKLGIYRMSGILALPCGGILAGIFASIDCKVGRFRAHGCTLPGLFTAVCFSVWLLFALAWVRGSCPVLVPQKAYRFDPPIVALMCIVLSAALTGASLLYVMPVIMTQLFKWSMASTSAAFSAAGLFAFIGTCAGHSRRAIRFNAAHQGFDAFPLMAVSAVLTLLGVALVWLGAELLHVVVAKAAFVAGICIAMFAQSLMGTAGGAVVALALTGPEGAGMGPLLKLMVSMSKILSPLFLVVETMLASWHLTLSIWCGGVVLLLLAVTLVRKVALFKGAEPR